MTAKEGSGLMQVCAECTKSYFMLFCLFQRLKLVIGQKDESVKYMTSTNWLMGGEMAVHLEAAPIVTG